MTAAPAPGDPLTARELEVARLIAGALTYRQIATRLSLSERTVHAHVQHIHAKTGTRNQVEVVLWLRGQRGNAGQQR